MANKLLLVKDVESLGRKGEIVTTRPGYARNFLLPQGLAVVADKQAIRLQARLQEERMKQAAVDKSESEAQKVRLEVLELSTFVKVDQEGHMYGSVNAQDIADLIAAGSGIALERRSVQLNHPIKATGVHKIVIKLKEGVTATVNVKVVPEGSTLETPQEEPQK
jgi:large subunit ribosomal protein L9